MRLVYLFLLGVLLVVTVAPVSTAVSKAAIKDVSGALVCQCGCGSKVVATCGCGEADKTEADIAKQLEQGKTKEQILATYVSAYGEQVLAAPTKKGFNLTAWLMPIVAVLSGGLIIRTAIIRWRKSGRETESLRHDAPTLTDIDAKHRDRIARELEELE